MHQKIFTSSPYTLDLPFKSSESPELYTTKYESEYGTYFRPFARSISADIQKTPRARWSSPSIETRINGIYYSVDIKLKSLIESVESSKYILDLEDDWDEAGALSCNEESYNNAIKLLIKYSKELLTQYSVIIKNPDISPCRDGSIDLEWRDDNSSLLINITTKSEIDIHYYAEDYRTNTILKGFLNDLQINRELLFWMQKLK